jgi:GNAT superfamily N-acetyltransferase
MSAFTTREARLEDAGAIADILVTSWQSAYPELLDPDYLRAMDKKRYTQMYAESIFKVREKIFIAESGSTVLGFILGNLLTEGPYDCEVKELYVHPEQQGKGIGNALLTAMTAFFREAGMKRMLIWALRGARNNDFYQKMGGIAREQTETEVGGRKYPIIGFVFALEKPG